MQTNIKVEIEDLSSVKKKLAITIPAEAVKREINEAYQALRSTSSIAGFRKGTAPLSILKAKYGSLIQEDVTKKLIEGSYPRALNEKKLTPVETPKVDLATESIEEGKDFSYTVTVEVNPEINIDGYKGMELKQEDPEVSAQDIEVGLRGLREAAAQFQDVDRAAKDGDLVVVDFEAFLGNEPIKNGKGTDYPAVIGEKTLLPGFDEALRGSSKGEAKETNIKFPDNYSEGHLAGKDGTFKINIKAVKEKTMPELDEEFAKKLGCENLVALSERVRTEIVNHKQAEVKEKVKTEILDKLIEKHQFDVPETLVNRYLGMILNRIIDNMRQGVFAPGDKGLTPEELKVKYRDMAVRSVKEDIVLDHIAAKEKVEASNEEVEESVRKLAEARGASYEALMGRIEREGAMDVIKDGLKHEKVFDIIIGSSKPAA